jgi:uncharacterized damage-inducible protein DinB
MSEIVRQDPPSSAPEKEMLTAFLDYHRATLLIKVEGVSDEDLRRRPTVSSMTLLGLVKHLAYVERSWFQHVFAALEVDFPWTKADPDADWRIEDTDTTEDILNLYKTEVAKSREVIAAGDLEAIAKREGADRSLRWILVHMIEETARHNGHADIFREAIDGVTGE